MSTFWTPGIQKCENLTFSHFGLLTGPGLTSQDPPWLGTGGDLGFWKSQNVHAFREEVEREELKTPQNSDRDGGRSPHQDDVYQQTNHIS